MSGTVNSIESDVRRVSGCRSTIQLLSGPSIRQPVRLDACTRLHRPTGGRLVVRHLHHGEEKVLAALPCATSIQRQAPGSIELRSSRAGSTSFA